MPKKQVPNLEWHGTTEDAVRTGRASRGTRGSRESHESLPTRSSVKSSLLGLMIRDCTWRIWWLERLSMSDIFSSFPIWGVTGVSQLKSAFLTKAPQTLGIQLSWRELESPGNLSFWLTWGYTLPWDRCRSCQIKFSTRTSSRCFSSMYVHALHIYTRIYTYVHTYMHAYIHTYVCSVWCKFSYTCKCTHVHLHMHIEIWWPHVNLYVLHVHRHWECWISKHQESVSLLKRTASTRPPNQWCAGQARCHCWDMPVKKMYVYIDVMYVNVISLCMHIVLSYDTSIYIYTYL